MNIKKTKKYVIGIGLVILILLGVLNACSTGACSTRPIEHEIVNTDDRFQIDYFQILDGGCVQIVIDKETGIKYLFIKKGSASGLTKLEE